jgi:conjugative transfer signal peptidase TraF
MRRDTRAHHLLIGLLAAALAALLLPAPPPPGMRGPPAAAAAGWQAGLRFNLSASLPRGVYLLTPLPRPAARGDLVLACPPPAAAALARRRGYLDAGPCPGGSRPLGKLVLAAAGDWIEIGDGPGAGGGDGGLVVNGCRLPVGGAPARDTRGRTLPRVGAGRYRVRPGEVWLFSPHRRSFDSRCFGPVAAPEVRGLLHPLLVLEREPVRRWAALLRGCAGRR